MVQFRKILIALAYVSSWLTLWTPLARAESAPGFEFIALAGAIHLPTESFHRLGYGVEMAFGSREEMTFNFAAGMAHPNYAFGYAERIGYVFFGPQFYLSRFDFVKPYAGMGFGVFMNQVAQVYAWLPALATKAGFKLGWDHFGVQLEVSNFMGVADLVQLVLFTAWPLINGMGGFYFAF